VTDRRDIRRWGIGGGVALVLLHALLFSRQVDAGTNAVMLCTNLLALWAGLAYQRAFSERRFLAYVAGYLVLFILFYVVGRSPLLFAAFGMMYVGCFRHTLLLGYLLILIFSVTMIPAYWLPATLLGGTFFTIALHLYPQRQKRFVLGAFAVGFLLVTAVVLPLLYLCFQTKPQTLINTFGQAPFRGALLTSLYTATVATLVVLLFGLPLAYAMARLEFWGKGFIDSLIDLPIVIPQPVVGIALLVTLGPKTTLGKLLERAFGTGIQGTALGIIACQVFVSSPFLVRSAMNAFRDMGPELENVSRTLGASPMSAFFRVSLPLAFGAIFNGCILTWARAVSEFGALKIVAYTPYTVSTYAQYIFEKYGQREAESASVLLVIVCMWGFLVLRWMRSTGLGPLFAGARSRTDA